MTSPRSKLMIRARRPLDFEEDRHSHRERLWREARGLGFRFRRWWTPKTWPERVWLIWLWCVLAAPVSFAGIAVAVVLGPPG